MEQTTPKKAGLLYDAKHAVWSGETGPEVVPENARTLQDYRGRNYRSWETQGYRWNREEDGKTTAYRL